MISLLQLAVLTLEANPAQAARQPFGAAPLSTRGSIWTLPFALAVVLNALS